MSKNLPLRSLPVRLVVGFVGLVILTALAAGLPAIWTLRAQLDAQAQSQLDQGVRSTQALLAAQPKDLTTLALLTAQRPTLRALIANDSETLIPYLETLRSGANLSLIALCTPTGARRRPARLRGSLFVPPLAKPVTSPPPPLPPTLWMVASHTLEDPTQGSVVVGLALDEAFVQTLHEQTTLEQILLVNGEIAAATFPPAALTDFTPPVGPATLTLGNPTCSPAPRLTPSLASKRCLPSPCAPSSKPANP
jgi:hypothetical protein